MDLDDDEELQMALLASLAEVSGPQRPEVSWGACIRDRIKSYYIQVDGTPPDLAGRKDMATSDQRLLFLRRSSLEQAQLPSPHSSKQVRCEG